jgi:hypothetical protein
MATKTDEEATDDAISLVNIVDKTLLRGDDGRRRDECDHIPPRCYVGTHPYDTNMIVGTFLKKLGVQLTIFLHDDEHGKVAEHLQKKNLIDGLEKHYGNYVTLVLGGSSDSIGGWSDSSVDADDYITSMHDLLEFKRRYLNKVVESETSAFAGVSLG